MTRKQTVSIIAIAFFVGAIGSIFFDRALIPWASSIKGLDFLSKLSSNAPIVITRREEIRLNEGANLIELAKQAQNFTVSIYGGKNPDYRLLGNGIVLANDGLIFTSKEILGNLQEFQIVLNDGRVYLGLLRALDPKTELAVLTIPASSLAVAEFADASSLTTAQRILALGKTNNAFTRKFASGLVTKIVANDLSPFQTVSADAFYQSLGTDAMLSLDFAGGPVVNLEGRVVGMVVNNNGKILISEAIQPAVKSYLDIGKITRPYYGFRYINMTKPLANLRKIEPGALIVDANNAQLKAGDLIIEVNGSKVSDLSLEQLLLKNQSGEIKLTVLRDGKRLELIFKSEIK